MASLRYRFNYRQDLLPAKPLEFVLVGVYVRTGDPVRVRWLGTKDLSEARRLPGARPVRLEVTAYSLEDGDFPFNWQEVPQGWFIQGALVSDGVYGVTVKNRPRLVHQPLSPDSSLTGGD